MITALANRHYVTARNTARLQSKTVTKNTWKSNVEKEMDNTFRFRCRKMEAAAQD